MLDVCVADDEDLEAAEARRADHSGAGKVDCEREPGDDEDEDEFEEKEIHRLLQELEARRRRLLRHRRAITHCCLEPHGSTVQWKGKDAGRLPLDAKRLRHG